MNANNAYIVDCNVISAYGLGTDALWDGIKSDETAIREFLRFDTNNYKCPNAAFVDDEFLTEGDSFLMKMLNSVFVDSQIDKEAKLIFASTVGEVDLLERAVVQEKMELIEESTLLATAKKIQHNLCLEKEAVVLSAACASSTAAVSRALSMIRNGEEECIVIVAADMISDFVYSGFTSLLALDDNSARPFDATRTGLSVGEAAGYLVLASDNYIKENNIEPKYLVSGAGQSNDANHMTGPSRDGKGLALAIRRALESASCKADLIDFIAAHGTGTKYNDSMELKAFKSTFEYPKPVFSIKGAIGHTMGSAGLTQMIVAIKAMQENYIPKTVALDNIDPEADCWVYDHSFEHESNRALVVNAGFGGINAAVILEKICM